MKFRLLFMICCLVSAATYLSAQSQDKAPENWFLLDPATDKYPGISMEKTYKELLKNRQGETVIVAVIDSGVDYEHEDLQEIMWINEDEIAGNGIDDDKNGYVDDIHGWNFIGGKGGKNIDKDALEISRLAAYYAKKFDGKDVSALSKKEKAEYEKYQKIKKEIEEKKQEVQQQSMGVVMFNQAFESVKKAAGTEKLTEADLEKVKDNTEVAQAVAMIKSVLAKGATLEDLADELAQASEYFETQLEYYYNPDYDPRAEIVGDNYKDANQRYYGNNDYEGPDANHGTHVSGIIAAVRGNNVGMNGISNNVRIMSVRAVPDGDERDKDVANAIRYAVDNGASVINMSFGKSYGWDKKVVDDAVKYAMKKDVLLVHAAGNDGKDNDATDNFPNDRFDKKGWFKPRYARNWIEVGALNWKGGENLPAGFSNYGKEKVDVFAPGVAIYSTTVDNTYDSYPGTSMASPMVAGVAAVLRSHFPTLTAQQVKEIILESSVKQNIMVKKPGSDEKVNFSDLSVTGGVLSAYEAVKKAMTVKGKKKIKKKKSMDTARP